MNKLSSYFRTRTTTKFVSIILSIALLVTMVPITLWAALDAVIDGTDITIETAAPENGKPIVDGTVTVNGGTPVVTWSSDGQSYAAASGTFAPSTVYRTKYVLTADAGYVFDPASGVYEKGGGKDLSNRITNLIRPSLVATFTATVSTVFTLNDTLTIIVSWPNATIEPSDISIGTVAPVTGAAIEDGTNTFNKGTIVTTWTSSARLGKDFVPAEGTFVGFTDYTTRYVITANEGYAFDMTSGIYVDGAKSLRSRIANLGTALLTRAEVSSTTYDNDTLTVYVLWNTTEEDTSLPIIRASDITIGTVAPAPFAVKADGTNTFNRARLDGGVEWNPNPPGGIFESGKSYKSSYYLFASDGYSFDEGKNYLQGESQDLSSRILNLGSGSFTVSRSLPMMMSITVTWPMTGLLMPTDISIGTLAPIAGTTMENGSNTFNNASAAIDWSADNSTTYTPASGTYDFVTTYKTQYVITAATGYFFDSTPGVYESGGGKEMKSRIANLGSGTYTAVVSGGSNDTLTIVVTWPQTAAMSFTTIDVSELSIGTVAPVTGGSITNGTNAFAHSTANVKWSADNGASYASASGIFAPGKAYKTQYVLKAEDGYVFDSTTDAYASMSISNLGSGTVSMQVSTTSTSNDTLTITVSWPTTDWATIAANELVIGTIVPATGESMADGTNTFPNTTGVATWSSDGGVSYAAASGTYAPQTVYKTKYVLTADYGYMFDSAMNAYNAIAVENLNGAVLSADVSTSSTTNDTLTIIVTWPATDGAMIVPADISIGTIAPVTGATQTNGTNTFAHATGSVSWSSDGGASYAAAGGTYAAAKVYKTKYVLTAMAGYAFDSTAGVYEKNGAKDLSGRIDHLGASSFSATILTTSLSNDTLTIVVTWPATDSAMIVPADISIGTVAPATGAAQSNGSNIVNHATASISWSTDNGGTYQPAGGTYIIGKSYKTKYVLTAAANYRFDSTAGAYDSINVANLSTPSGSFTTQVSTRSLTNDTLTIIVTWPMTANTDIVKVNVNNTTDFRAYSGNTLIPAEGLTVSAESDYTITLVNTSINTMNPSAPLTAAMVKSVEVKDNSGNNVPASVQTVSTGVAQNHPWSLKITIDRNASASSRQITVTVNTDTAQRIDIRNLIGFTNPTIEYAQSTPRSAYPYEYGNYFYFLADDSLKMKTTSNGLIPAGVQLVGKNSSKTSPVSNTQFDTVNYQFGYTFTMPNEPIFLSVTSTDGKAAHNIVVQATIPGVVTPKLSGGPNFKQVTASKPATDYSGATIIVDPGSYNTRMYKVTGIDVRSDLLNVALPVTTNGDGTYSFVMPFTDANVTVRVQRVISNSIQTEITTNPNAEMSVDIEEYYPGDTINVQILNKDPEKYLANLQVYLVKGSSIVLLRDLRLVNPYDSRIDVGIKPFSSSEQLVSGVTMKVVAKFESISIPVTTTKTVQFSNYPSRVSLNEPFTISFLPPSDASKIYKPIVSLRDRLKNKTIEACTYVSSDPENQMKSLYSCPAITKNSIDQIELLYQVIDTDSPAADGEPGATKLRNIASVSPNSRLAGLFKTINVFGSNMNGEGKVFIGTSPNPTTEATVTNVTENSLVIQVPSNLISPTVDVTYYLSSNGVQRSVTIPATQNLVHTKFGYMAIISDSKFHHSVIISESEKDMTQQVGDREKLMTIKGTFTANKDKSGEYVFSGSTIINNGLAVYLPNQQSLLNVYDNMDGTVKVTMEKVNMNAGTFSLLQTGNGSISLVKDTEYISEDAKDEDGKLMDPSKQNIEVELNNQNKLMVLGTGMQAGITGATLIKDSVILEGRLHFNMAMPGSSKVGIILDIDKLQYDTNDEGNMNFKGVSANGTFTPGNDMSNKLLGGFGIKGNAEGSIDTFTNKYAIDFEMDAKLANFSSSMSIHKNAATGLFIPNSIKIVVGLGNGIPVTPMTPIANLTRVGGEVSGLAETINGDYKGIAPILIKLIGDFEVGIPGAELLEFNDVTLAIGPSQISLSGKPTLLKMDIFDKFQAGIYLTNESVSYQMQISANILKNFSVILAGGSADLTYYRNNGFNLNGQLYGRLQVPEFEIGQFTFGPYTLLDEEVGLSNTNAYASFNVINFGFKVNYAFGSGSVSVGRRSFASAQTGTAAAQTVYDENGTEIGQINAFSNVRVVSSSGASRSLLRTIAVEPTISTNAERTEHTVSFPAGLTEDYALLVSADPDDLRILDPDGNPYGLTYPETLDDGTPYYDDPNANAAVVSESTVMIRLGANEGNWTIASSQPFDSSIIAIAPIPNIAGTSYDVGTHQVSWDLKGLDTATENYQVEVRLSTDNGDDPRARSTGVLIHTVDVSESDVTEKVASGSYTFTTQDLNYLQSGEYYARVTLIGTPISTSRSIPYASMNAKQAMSVVNPLAPGSISSVTVSAGGSGTIHAAWSAVTDADGYLVRLYDEEGNAVISPLTYTDEIGSDGIQTGTQIAHSGRPIEYQVLAEDGPSGQFSLDFGGFDSGNSYRLAVTPFSYADDAGINSSYIFGTTTVTDIVEVPLVKTPVIYVKPSSGIIKNDSLLGDLLRVNGDFTLDLATTYVSPEDGQTQDLNTKFTVWQSDGTIDEDTNLPTFVQVYASADYEDQTSVPISVDGDAGSTLLRIVAVNDQGDITEYELAVHYNSLPPVLFVETGADGKIVANSEGRYEIKGSTMPYATVLDDRGNRATADDVGEFSLSGRLSSGTQAYTTVTAIDSVGNVAQDDVSIVKSSKPADPGAGPDTDTGNGNGNGSGSNPGSDPGAGPDTGNGNGSGSNPGSDPGSDPGAGPDTGNGNGSGSNPGSGSGSTPSTDNGTPVEKTFKDVHAEAAWAEEAIERAYKLGIVSGRTADVFAPNSNTRRNEAISMLVRALHLPIGKQADLDAAAAYFADWNELAQWSRQYIAAAYANGLVAGTERNGKHYVNGASFITRAEVVVLLQNAYQLTADEGNRRTFGDAIPTWAENSVNIMSSNGVINGYPDSTFRPASNATRAEIVVMLIGLIDRQEKVTPAEEE